MSIRRNMWKHLKTWLRVCVDPSLPLKEEGIAIYNPVDALYGCIGMGVDTDSVIEEIRGGAL